MCVHTNIHIPWTLASLAVLWLPQTKGNHVMEFEAVVVEPGAMPPARSMASALSAEFDPSAGGFELLVLLGD